MTQKTWFGSGRFCSGKTIINIDIIPNQNIVNGLEKEIVTSIDYDFYNSERTYPYVNVSMSDPMVMRDVVVSNITVIPFKYNPSLSQLEI